jgi:hypothetical protein
MDTPSAASAGSSSRDRVLLILAVVAGAAATAWRLWEQDVFWQVRAGREFLATWNWPVADTWSYTAAGGPWRNFQWLSTLLMAAADLAAGTAGLVVLRVLGVAAVLLATVTALRRRGAGTLLALVLTGLVWLACARRFQMRSDLFVVIIFAAVLAVEASSLGWLGRRVAFVGLVVLAANLHPGTAPFVQLAALTALARDRRSWRHEIPPAAGILLALLVTPYHVHVVPYLWRHFFYQAYQAVPNPDHRALLLVHFLPSEGGVGTFAWLVLVAAAGFFLMRELHRAGRALVGRDAASFLLLLLLAGLCVNRDRVMPYAAIFAATRLAELVPPASSSRRRMAMAAAACVWLLAIPLWLSRPEVRFGFGLDQRLQPVGAARFIASYRPERQLLHFQGDGNYLLRALPEYPVFLDTRESMYEHLGAMYRDMVNSPELMNAVMTRYGVNTVLLPELFLTTAWRDGISRRAAFFPKRDFALVYFDDTHAVLVRRIPAHADLIAAHEYEYLLPYRAPRAYLGTRDRTPERDQAFWREVARCRREVPDLVHCQLAEQAR